MVRAKQQRKKEIGSARTITKLHDTHCSETLSIGPWRSSHVNFCCRCIYRRKGEQEPSAQIFLLGQVLDEIRQRLPVLGHFLYDLIMLNGVDELTNIIFTWETIGALISKPENDSLVSYIVTELLQSLIARKF